MAPGYFYALTGPALSAAVNCDGTQLLALADLWNSRTAGSPGTVTGYTAGFQDNAALFCTDRPWPRGNGSLQINAGSLRSRVPHPGAERTTMALPCGTWPTTDLPHTIRADGSESHGHTAYGGNGSSCLDAHVDDYIVTAVPPVSGTAC